MRATPDDHLELEACFPDHTWFGLGLGGHLMTNAELVFFMAPTDIKQRKVISTVMPDDSRSTRPSFFPEDSPIYEREISSCGDGMILFKVRRPLDAGDKHDYMEVLKRNTPIDMSVAGLYNEFNTTYNMMPGHTKGKGFHQILSIIINDDGIITKVGVSDQYLLHGYFLWSVWSLFGLLQIASLRYMKKHWKVGIWLHRFSAITIWTATVYSGVSMIQHENWEIKENPHAQGGFVMVLAITFPIIGGITVKYLQESTKWKTALMLNVKAGHKVLGYFLIFAGQFTSLMGGMRYAEISGISKYEVIGFQVISVFFLILFYLEVNHRMQDIDLDKKVTYPILTIDDVDQMQQVVILDNLVLDVSKYKWEHPGGAFLFDQLKGRDISKFYYGGYSLETGVKPVKHSRIADIVVRTLVVGQISGNAKESEGHVILKGEVNKSTSVITIDMGKASVEGDGLENLGKHMLIGHNNEKRQYTIANSMRASTYEALLEQINDSINRKKVKNDSIPSTNDVTVVVKNYKTGISKFLNEAPLSQPVSLRGPLGKGLNLKADETVVGFVGGTGVLVFMDLVALLAKQALNLSPTHFGNAFKLILHVSFESKTQSIGLSLLEKYHELVQKKGLNNFELHLRFCDEDKGRWGKEYAKKQFKGRDLAKTRFLVCGPPKMNAVLDRAFEEISKEEKIRYEVL